MATTSPDNIWTPDAGDDYALTTDLAATADTIQDALNTVKNYLVGTDAARLALSGPALFAGLSWYSSDTGVAWIYDGSAWRVNTSSIVHLASGVVSAQATINIDGLTGFSEYEITLDLPTASTANGLNAQVRAGGVTSSAANYDFEILTGSDSTAAASGSNAATSWQIAGARTDKMVVIRLVGLNQGTRTAGNVTTAAWNAAANPLVSAVSIRNRAASSYNGVSITTSAGTVSGTYTVRGIR